ncbi:hypothetical protein [Mariniluteicoccus flavus]
MSDMTTLLLVARDRIAHLHAEAANERLADSVLGPRSWWRRLLGLRAPATPRRTRPVRPRHRRARVARYPA